MRKVNFPRIKYKAKHYTTSLSIPRTPACGSYAASQTRIRATVVYEGRCAKPAEFSPFQPDPRLKSPGLELCPMHHKRDLDTYTGENYFLLGKLYETEKELQFFLSRGSDLPDREHGLKRHVAENSSGADTTIGECRSR